MSCRRPHLAFGDPHDAAPQLEHDAAPFLNAGLDAASVAIIGPHSNDLNTLHFPSAVPAGEGTKWWIDSVAESEFVLNQKNRSGKKHTLQQRRIRERSERLVAADNS